MNSTCALCNVWCSERKEDLRTLLDIPDLQELDTPEMIDAVVFLQELLPVLRDEVNRITSEDKLKKWVGKAGGVFYVPRVTKTLMIPKSEFDAPYIAITGTAIKRYLETCTPERAHELESSIRETTKERFVIKRLTEE